MTDRVSKIAAALERLPQALPDCAAEKFATLLLELERWNQRINLTAIRDPDEMITGHVLDSLAVAPLLEGKTILDVGTGAGFPGLPLAIAEPEREFTLLDSNNKKIMFAQHAAGLLGLENVLAVRCRGEDYAPVQCFDTVIARALGTLPRLVDIAGHLVGEDGVFVALKGCYPAAELQALEYPWTYTVNQINVPGLEQGSRHAVLLRRETN